ncbi:MAG: hypothetical protein H0W58_13280 [Acidobacteria bacterium]|jgi:hypothetical protein|nr:hypothetical protein [Acidobacteriota bacterium]
MKKVSLKNCESLLHAVLLISVLAGLLFSCGEGIRLFPFPITKTSENSQSRLKDNDKTPYQLNVHRFESNQGNSQLKFQRDNSHHHWMNNYNALNNSLFFSPTAYFKINFPLDLKTFNSRLLSASAGSRAPPFVS